MTLPLQNSNYYRNTVTVLKIEEIVTEPFPVILAGRTGIVESTDIADSQFDAPVRVTPS